MSNRPLVRKFDLWRNEGEPLALATVVGTAGSTYSKTGRQILIRADGQFEGLISGGCLEGDLAEHAKQVIRDGIPQRIDYDMRDEADELWGMGLGCNGMMHIVMQRLSDDNDWQPFSAMAEAMAYNTTTLFALVAASSHRSLEIGHGFVANDKNNWNSEAELPFSLTAPDSLPSLEQYGNDEWTCEVVYWRAAPWPRLLVLGAGPDAHPVLQLADTLGWEVTIADHRENYIQSDAFKEAANVTLVTPDLLDTELQLDHYHAVVVMSHHLETDRQYLKHLANYQNEYVGVLGPTARKERLLEDLQQTNSEFARRLHGPVGLQIGADSPQTIALALAAEIQATLAKAHQ